MKWISEMVLTSRPFPFQYAFGRRISLINNNVLKLDISGFDEDNVYKRRI